MKKYRWDKQFSDMRSLGENVNTPMTNDNDESTMTAYGPPMFPCAVTPK